MYNSFSSFVYSGGKLVLGLFPKNKKILMSYQEEVEFNAIGFPVACSFAIMLFFNNYLF